MDMEKKFKELWARVTRPGAEALLKYLEEETDFFTAPASTRFHGCYPGGLVEHSVDVYKLLSARIGEDAAAPWPDAEHPVSLPQESIIITALLHDVCKVNTYVPETRNRKVYDPEKVAQEKQENPRNVKKDGKGEYFWESYDSYEYSDDMPYGHGEKSVFLVSQFMRLSEEEALMMRWHMGYTDGYSKESWAMYSNACRKYPSCLAIFEADVEATHILRNEDQSYFLKAEKAPTTEEVATTADVPEEPAEAEKANPDAFITKEVWERLQASIFKYRLHPKAVLEKAGVSQPSQLTFSMAENIRQLLPTFAEAEEAGG